MGEERRCIWAAHHSPPSPRGEMVEAELITRCQGTLRSSLSANPTTTTSAQTRCGQQGRQEALRTHRPSTHLVGGSRPVPHDGHSGGARSAERSRRSSSPAQRHRHTTCIGVWIPNPTYSSEPSATASVTFLRPTPSPSLSVFAWWPRRPAPRTSPARTSTWLPLFREHGREKVSRYGTTHVLTAGT